MMRFFLASCWLSLLSRPLGLAWGLVTAKAAPVRVARPVTTPEDDLLTTELRSVGLGLCHGLLHAAGVRRLADLACFTQEQVQQELPLNSFDRRNLLRIRQEHAPIPTGSFRRKLSTRQSGAFDNPHPPPLQLHNLCASVHGGRLLTAEQCQEINLRAEVHNYQQLEQVGGGWTNELYTLTDQHLPCHAVPDLRDDLQGILEQQLFPLLYKLYPNICPGSLALPHGEPHLVKYSGRRAKGTVVHTDSDHGITVNIALSNLVDDYAGGGTYFCQANQTIHPQAGEMLIHLGSVPHAGVEITSGVRRILIAFLTCEWENGAGTPTVYARD